MSGKRRWVQSPALQAGRKTGPGQAGDAGSLGSSALTPEPPEEDYPLASESPVALGAAPQAVV